jgi:hypothetical protein
MVSYSSGPLLGHVGAGAVAAAFGVTASVISGGSSVSLLLSRLGCGCRGLSVRRAASSAVICADDLVQSGCAQARDWTSTRRRSRTPIDV